MNNILAFLFLLATNLSIGQSQLPLKAFKKIDQFSLATETHKLKKVWKTLEKDYRNEQLAFLGGNKVQLIDELYSGSDADGKWHNCTLKQVQKIELAEYEEKKDGMYELFFTIHCEDAWFTCSLTLVQNGKKWSFVGAVG